MSNDAHRAEPLSEERGELAREGAGGSSGTAPGELMRLFVAIAPPPGVLDELDTLTRPFHAGRPDLRWTSREAWHVTLAFLGQVDELAAARLLPRLERAAHRHRAVPLTFSGAGAFPAATRANVLWSGLAGDRQALARLAESVAAGASRAGAPPTGRQRRFQPHLTLARCRIPADVTPIVTALAGYQGPTWTADRLHLVRSRLSPAEQARYTTLGSWPLRPPDPAPADPAPAPSPDKPEPG
jgi:2'-5' RNA ligase